MTSTFSQAARMTCFLFLLLQLQGVNAQFVEIAPIQTVKYPKKSLPSDFSRTLNQNSIPFWDDFSRGIDTLKWSPLGVSFTETIYQNAPSYGAILFDGVDQNGKPYSFSINDQGETDFLTAKSFDLTGIPANKKETLFLSFFWQAGGKAEVPDPADRLVLQILNAEGNWIPVWSRSGGAQNDRNVFRQEIIKIRPEWQHANFQFRFFSDGRKSGPFDSWILDYVYLNTGRSETNLTYPDRSLTRINKMRFGDYGAYPFELLEASKETWSVVENEFLNLENRFRAMEFTTEIKDDKGNRVLSVNSNTPFNPVPNALERRTFVSRKFDELPPLDSETDLIISNYLTTGDDPLFEITGGDTTYFASVDFRINDTLKTVFPIRDFMAYDNGSADYAAGVNQKSGQLAVKYSVPTPVFLKGISINFSNANQANQAVDIVVWKELDRPPIFKKENFIPAKIPGEDFIYYSLDTNLRVQDDFYVGFIQYTNDFIHVGLDKTNDQGDKIYYNVVGAWAQNEEVKGSLMIRPHLSLASPFEESTLPESGFRIFPNPVADYLTINGKVQDLKIFDSFGREILPEREKTEAGEIVNFTGQKPGIYIINLISETGIQSFRILVSK
jgi:hypothetical protein